jgi:RNA polymerase sigma-70 factor (ECF subfamily)
MGEPTDEQLLRASVRDAEAFGAFYARHAEAILGYLLRRTGSIDAAADLTAEVFAAALAARRRFRPRAEPARAWLFGIANHKLADARRRRGVEERARRRLGMPRRAFDDDELERAEERVDLARRGGALAALVEDLPPAQREAVLARVVDERDYEDLAAAFGTTSANVRQRVRRGLAALEKTVTEEGYR